MISYVPKKIHNINIVVWSCCSKRLLSGIHNFLIFICDSASQLVMVQTSKEKVPHIHKEYEYSCMKSCCCRSHHKIKHQILELLEKTKRRQTYHICQGHFQIKLLI